MTISRPKFGTEISVRKSVEKHGKYEGTEIFLGRILGPKSWSPKVWKTKGNITKTNFGPPIWAPMGRDRNLFPVFQSRKKSVTKFSPEISVPNFGFFTARIRRHFGPGFGPAISGPCAGPLSKFRPTQSGPQSRNHVKSHRIVPYHGLPYFT
jgi:hypothetical protein